MGILKKYVIPIFLSLLFISLLGIGMALQRNTLVSWWKPAIISLLPAVPLGFLLSNVLRSITPLRSRIASIIAGVLLSFSVIFGGFYALNFYNTKAGTSCICRAGIVNRYTEERYRTKRVGRRTTRGEKYNVYMIVLRLPDGREKKMEISAGEYSGMRVGRCLELKIEEGFFGVPVIKNMRLPVRKHSGYY